MGDRAGGTWRRGCATRAAGAVALVLTSAAVVGARPDAAAATPSAGFHLLTPVRIADTRTTPGASTGALVPLQERRVVAAGVGGVSADATRVAVRITVTGGAGAGQLRVHACGAYDPAARGLIDVEPITDTALALPLLHSGAFCVTSTVATDLVVDVEGYEGGVGGMAFVATPRVKMLDRVEVAAGAVVPVQIAGAAGIAAGAGAVSIELFSGGADAGFTTAYPCDQGRPLASTVSYPPGYTYGAAAIGPLSTSGTLCLYSFAAGHVSLYVDGYWADGATPSADGPATMEFETVRPPGFVPVTPVRAFDTRSAGGALAAGGTHELDLTGRAPADATDVVLNVTVTEPTAAGFVTVYPCEATRPVVSNLNFVAGQTVPNLVTVSLGSDNRVCFFSNVATHLLADLSGWYVLGGGDGLVTHAPSRLFDTRLAGGALGAGGTYQLDLAGTIDASASAVIMNVTVTEAAAPGFVTVYPCSAGRPTASNLNYVTRQTVPNLVTVAVGADRKVCFYASGPTHLIADLGGWYSRSSAVGFVGQVPERVFDTRDSVRLATGGTKSYTAGPGRVATSEDHVVAVVFNVTAVDPTGPGFVTVYPCAEGRPNSSNVNFVAAQIVPNLVVVAVDPDDRACFYAHAATDLVVDEAGFFTELPYLRYITVR